MCLFLFKKVIGCGAVALTSNVIIVMAGDIIFIFEWFLRFNASHYNINMSVAYCF